MIELQIIKQRDNGQISFTFHLRRPSDDIAVPPILLGGVQKVPVNIWEAIEDDLKKSIRGAFIGGVDATSLVNIGQVMMFQLLPANIRSELAKAAGVPILIQTNELEDPWELIHLNNEFLGIRNPVGRVIQFAAGPDGIAQVPFEPLMKKASFLIIANPTADSELRSGIREEIAALRTLFQHFSPDHIQYDLLPESEAEFAPISRMLTTGQYNVIHYTGHILYDQARQESYLPLNDLPLYPSDLNIPLQGNPLVVINGCGSDPDQPVASYTQHFARRFLINGARGFIGTICEVPADGTHAFIIPMYMALLRGLASGEALQHSRSLNKEKNLFWAPYILYSDPRQKLVEVEPGPFQQNDELNQIHFEQSAVDILQAALNEAREMELPAIRSPHVCIALLDLNEGLLRYALSQQLKKIHLDKHRDRALRGLRVWFKSCVSTTNADPQAAKRLALKREYFSENMVQMLETACAMSMHMPMHLVGERDLLLAMLDSEQGVMAPTFNALGFSLQDVKTLVAQVTSEQMVEFWADKVCEASLRADEKNECLYDPSQPFELCKADAQLNRDCFDETGWRIMLTALAEAKHASVSQIVTGQLFIALTKEEGGLTQSMLRLQPHLVAKGINDKALRYVLRKGLEKEFAALGMKIDTRRFTLNIDLKRDYLVRIQHILDDARVAARKEASRIGERHLLWAFLKHRRSTVEWLEALKVNIPMMQAMAE